MALFPQGLSAVDARCNAGERRVLQQLRRCLDDDSLVWFDVPIGPAARQPDFVVLSPRQGLLLLEVKDWKRSSLGSATRDRVSLHTARGEVTVANPLRQARDVTLELVDLMQRDPALVHAAGPFRGQLLFPYGWGVVFAGLRAADVDGSDFHSIYPAHKVLLRDDLDDSLPVAALQQRLWGLFTVHYPHTLTLPQRDRIRWHLFPEIRMAQQAALDFDGSQTPLTPQAPLVLPDLMQVMDLQQEQVARGLGEGHRVIHGAAGSGKTMILVFRAQQLAQAVRSDQPILVLCFNRSLAGRIDALLRARGVDERVQVRTFHAWCQDLVRSYQLAVPEAADADARWRALADTVARAVDTGFVPGGQYSALLVDEAHDFEDDWLRIAARMVNPATRSLLVLYDDAQSIYQRQRRRRFSFASLGIEARGRTSILKLNYRNTAEVLALAMHCAQGLLDGSGQAVEPGDDAEDATRTVQPASAGRRGPLPVLLLARHAQEEADWLADRVAAALAAGQRSDEIAVLFRTKAMMAPLARTLARRGLPVQSMAAPGFRRIDWRHPGVKLLTLHSAKGLEFPTVLVAGLQVMPMRGEPLADALRLLYVAMTRATGQLVLSAHGTSAVVQRVQTGLTAVGQQFAQAD
jgi:hypothetical protein